MVQWPRSAASEHGILRHLLWLRKFNGVRISSRAAMPSCMARATMFSQPCDIPRQFLLQPSPAEEEEGKPWLRKQAKPWRQRLLTSWNRTRARPVFWLAFAWSQQFAHWSVEHLPRLWYFLQLHRLLPHPPVLLVPATLAPWQLQLLTQLAAGTVGGGGGGGGRGGHSRSPSARG